ncbi:MAG TPA: hypothetical protein VMT27_10225 [Actinomycetes bacterium]|nr:hypothetical protein [Actinomycetes bacterium]
MDLVEERRALAEISARLERKYPHVPDDRIKSVVNDSYHELDDAHIRTFVGILVEKQANDRLASTPA